MGEESYTMEGHISFPKEVHDQDVALAEAADRNGEIVPAIFSRNSAIWTTVVLAGHLPAAAGRGGGVDQGMKTDLSTGGTCPIR
jgi:hypothetical protein